MMYQVFVILHLEKLTQLNMQDTSLMLLLLDFLIEIRSKAITSIKDMLMLLTISVNFLMKKARKQKTMRKKLWLTLTQ